MNAATPSVLGRIIRETRAEVERRKREVPLGALAWPPGGDRDAPRRTRGGFAAALRGPQMSVIAEFKRRSPSAGVLCEEPDLAGVLEAYRRGGAAALSVLTEGPNFGGSLDDLRDARSCGLPLLRKDFIVDEYQLHEAAAAGADAVLLIVAALDPAQLSRLHACAHALALDVLVEVHDRAELDAALELGAELIGINNRDLRDFSVDIARTETLVAELPGARTVVSESGISTPAQLQRLCDLGVSAVLVGESLMRAPDPAVALRALLAGAGAGAAAVPGRGDA